MYFLSDRRQKLTGAITSLSIPLPAESSLPPLSALPGEELHSLPSVPMTDLEPEQLLRTAQVIYTALIKVYLVARPVLVGSLCRIENWCDVEEVEELLKEKKVRSRSSRSKSQLTFKKFSDLIDLYQGKKMHKKALAMLHEQVRLPFSCIILTIASQKTKKTNWIGILLLFVTSKNLGLGSWTSFLTRQSGSSRKTQRWLFRWVFGKRDTLLIARSSQRMNRKLRLCRERL